MQTRIADLITAIGTDYKQFRTWITGSSGGDLTGLSTPTKTNLVTAINETWAAAASATLPDSTTAIKGKIAIATDAEALAMSIGTKAMVPANLAALANVANGLVKLNGSGTIPTSLFPASMDDVLEYANFAALPVTGSAGKIYTTLDNNKVFRWGGSAYVEISGSPGTTDAVPEGSVNLYYTAGRADARAQAQITALVGNTDTDLAAAYTTAKT